PSNGRRQAVRPPALFGHGDRAPDPGRVHPRRRRDRASHPVNEGGMGLPKPIDWSLPDRRPSRSVDRERIIANALIDVASELRLTDAAELVAMIRNDHAANIADLVNSSTELFFKSGTLRYALSASVKAPWDGPPVVALDMEFGHAMVSAFFRLTIGHRQAGVEIMDILFDEKGLSERAKAERLAAALASARVKGR